MGPRGFCRAAIELLSLEKTSKIIKSNCQPNTTVPAKLCPEVLHLHIDVYVSSRR